MEVYGIIYMIRNNINGKIYFGQTIHDFKYRYRHKCIENTHNSHLLKSIKKYGIENFTIHEQFDVAYSQQELDALEDMYICLYDTINSKYGYNKRRGGACGKATQEAREKNREAQKKLYEQGYTNPRPGAHMSQQQKQQMSKTRKEKGVAKGSKNPKAKKIKCVTDGMVFEYIRQASEYYDINPDYLSSRTKKGKPIKGLYFEFIDEQ